MKSDEIRRRVPGDGKLWLLPWIRQQRDVGLAGALSGAGTEHRRNIISTLHHEALEHSSAQPLDRSPLLPLRSAQNFPIECGSLQKANKEAPSTVRMWKLTKSLDNRSRDFLSTNVLLTRA